MTDEKRTSETVSDSSPFAKLDARALQDAGNITNLQDADEALAFLENHPRPAEIAAQGNAILEDPVQLKKLIRKIDFTIAPLLAAVYFLQFLDKTTLAYTAVMGIRTDTHLCGQDYSDVSMLFYIGTLCELLGKQKQTTDNSNTGIRLLGCRVPDAISGTADLATGPVPRHKHHDLGCCPLLPCCVHELRWSGRRAHSAWGF